MNLIQWDKDLLLTLNGFHTDFWDGFMWMATDEISWMAFFAVLLYTVYKNKGKEVLLFILSITLTILICDQVSGLFKDFFARPRPSRELSIMDQVHIVNGYRGGRFGFFSSHAANTFGIAVLVSFLMRHWLLTLVMISWALIESYSRIYLGVHYPLDVLTGIVFGALTGYGVYRLHRVLGIRFFRTSFNQFKALNIRGVVLTFFVTLFVLLIGAHAITDFLL